MPGGSKGVPLLDLCDLCARLQRFVENALQRERNQRE